MTPSPFAARIIEGLKERHLTLRALCREIKLDPSFFSKVLSGKRSPPMEEAVLRRIAEVLQIDACGLIVAAGRIPAEWWALRNDQELFKRMDALMQGKNAAAQVSSHLEREEAELLRPSAILPLLSRHDLAEELL